MLHIEETYRKTMGLEYWEKRRPTTFTEAGELSRGQTMAGAVYLGR